MHVGQRCYAQLCSPLHCTVNGGKTTEGAVLTVTMANGSKALCEDVHSLDLMFTAEGGDCQATVLSQLYVLDRL